RAQHLALLVGRIGHIGHGGSFLGPRVEAREVVTPERAASSGGEDKKSGYIIVHRAAVVPTALSCPLMRGPRARPTTRSPACRWHGRPPPPGRCRAAPGAARCPGGPRPPPPRRIPPSARCDCAGSPLAPPPAGRRSPG